LKTCSARRLYPPANVPPLKETADTPGQTMPVERMRNMQIRHFQLSQQYRSLAALEILMPLGVPHRSEFHFAQVIDG
jgi:hypothetical protein